MARERGCDHPALIVLGQDDEGSWVTNRFRVVCDEEGRRNHESIQIGSLDHIHLMVPDRYEAARWYAENLGFEIVGEYEEWARLDGGPLHVSADGGRTGLALFEIGQGTPTFKIEIGVAFSVDAETFVAFSDGLAERELSDGRGGRIASSAVADHDLCYTFYFQDPYGNAFELDCYDHAAVKRDLVAEHGITPVRFW